MASWIIPQPFMATSRAPAEYNVTCGPGMFVTTVLYGGSVRLARPNCDAKRAPWIINPPGMNREYSASARAPTAEESAFDSRVDARIAARRSSGSLICVPSVATMAET